jgi:uncharacterized membrane protein
MTARSCRYCSFEKCDVDDKECKQNNLSYEDKCDIYKKKHKSFFTPNIGSTNTPFFTPSAFSYHKSNNGVGGFGNGKFGGGGAGGSF